MKAIRHERCILLGNTEPQAELVLGVPRLDLVCNITAGLLN